MISKAAIALDCEILRAAVGEAGLIGHCEIICRLICVWRCVWACSVLCVRPPPILTGIAAVEEARDFALAARHLASQPRALADLVAAVVARNADAFGAIVDRFGLAPYCWQVCAWVCSEVCHEFCICVCPPPNTQPLFTYIGHFDIYTDIDPASGKAPTRDWSSRALLQWRPELRVLWPTPTGGVLSDLSRRRFRACR